MTALSKLRKCDLIKYIRRNAETDQDKFIRRGNGLKPLEIASCNQYRLTKDQLLNKAYRIKEKEPIQKTATSKKKISKPINCTKTACFGESIRYKHPSVAEGKKSEFKTRYKLIEANKALTSHMPEKSFKSRPGYPEGIQDRDYSKKSGEDQIAVIRNAKNLEPDLILVRSLSASEGTPIVDSNNFVLSGNSRAMSIFEASRNHAEKYKNYLNKLYSRANEFGLTKPAIDRFKKPMLVREVILKDKERPIFASNANKPISRMLDSVGKSLELAKVLESQADLASIINLKEGQTLRQFLTTASGKRFVDYLNLNTSPTERAAYFRPGGQLTETGKTVLEDAIFATVFTDRKTLESMSQSLRRALETSLPELIRLQQARIAGQIEAEDNLINSLKFAIDFIVSNPKFTENPDEWARQTAFIPKSSLGTGLDRYSIELLTQFGNKPRALRDRISKYLKSVVGQRAESAMFQTQAQSGTEILKRIVASEGGAAKSALFGLRKKRIKSTTRRK